MKHKVLSGVSALAIGLVLSACGSSSHTNSSNTTIPASSATTASSSPATTAAAAGTPITVGVVCDCTGPDAVISSASKAYSAFVDSVNDSGGLGGHPVKLITEDTTTNPGTAITAAQTLLSDHVVAIMDDTIFDSGWLAAAKTAGVPVVGGITSNVSMGTNADVYPIGMTDDAVTYAVVATLKSLGANAIGTLYCAEAPQCQAFVNLMKTAGQKLGVPTVYSAAIAPTAPDNTAQCVAAQQAHVTGMAMFLSTPPEVTTSADCAKQGYNPLYIINAEGFAPALLSSSGLKNLSMVLPEYPYWASSSVTQALNAALDKYFPGYRTSSAWNQTAMEGWAAALLFQAAVNGANVPASGTVTSASIVTALEAMNGQTLGGASVPLTFPAGQPHPIDCWFSGHLQNSVPSLLNSGSDSCETS